MYTHYDNDYCMNSGLSLKMSRNLGLELEFEVQDFKLHMKHTKCFIDVQVSFRDSLQTQEWRPGLQNRRYEYAAVSA